MRTFNSGLTGEFEIQGHPVDRAPLALLLDSSLAGAHIEDISYSDAGEWVVEEMGRVNLSDPEAIQTRIGSSVSLLEDLRAIALWPVAAHAHMQLIHQMKHLLDDGVIEAAGGDLPLAAAARWADDQVIAVDLRDPFAIADRIAASADKLASTESCRKWPGSAYAHRKVVTDLTVFLRRTRGTLH